jgi:hypothetical protein
MAGQLVREIDDHPSRILCIERVKEDQIWTSSETGTIIVYHSEVSLIFFFSFQNFGNRKKN